MEHVLLAAPEELHRRAGHLLGDGHHLPHPVVHRATPPEPATQIDLVDLALGRRQTRAFGRSGERRLAVLGGCPDLAAIGGEAGHRVHGLHAGMVLMRIRIDRLDAARRRRDRALGIATAVADHSVAGIKSCLQHLRKRLARGVCVLAEIPFDGQRIERSLGLPPGICDHRHRVVMHLHDLADTRALLDGGGIKAHDLSTEYLALADGCIQHARHGEVGTIDLLAVHLVGGIQTRQSLAQDLPVFGVLERHLGGRIQLGSRCRHLAVGGAAPACGVRDHALVHAALRGRHAPLIGSSLNQHHAGGRAPLADIVLRLADAATAAGGEIAPDALARQVFARRGLFGGDLGPVATELLGNHLREAGERSLAHFRAGDSHHHGVIGPDHHPGVHLGCAGALRKCFRGKGQMECEAESTSGGGGQKLAAGNSQFAHVVLPSACWIERPATRGLPPSATTLMAARTRL